MGEKVSCIPSLSASMALGIAGSITIYAASWRCLKRRIYLSQSSTQGEKKDSETVPDISEDSTPKPRTSWLDLAKSTAVTLGFLGLGVGVGVGLPMIAPTTVQDVLWLGFMAFQSWLVIQSALDTILPHPEVLKIDWTWRSLTWSVVGPEPTSPAPYTPLRLATVASVTILSVGGAYLGHVWLMCLPISAMVYQFLANLVVVDRPFRNTIKWLAYIQLGIAAFVGCGMIALEVYRAYWPPDPHAVDDASKSSRSQLSPEVLALMNMFQRVCTILIPGVFVALSLRFDYAQAIKAGVIPGQNDSTSPHSVILPPFPRPMFNGAMKVFVLQAMVLTLSYQLPLGPTFKETITIVEGLCLNVWFVVNRMMTVAEQSGVFMEFMDYSEPTLKKKEGIPGDKDAGSPDVEKARQDVELLSEKPDVSDQTTST